MKHLLFILLILISQTALADKATTILDKASSAFRSAGNVKIGFSLDVDGRSTTGYINLSDKKFFCDIAGACVWFDGTTMWHMIKSSDEVNVTTPSAAQVERMNPYAFLTIYKKGYKCKMGKSTGKYHEVIMTGQSGATYSTITVRFDKKTYEPLYTRMVTKKNTLEISVNSYLTHQKFDASSFRFNPKEYPKAEVIDLR